MNEIKKNRGLNREEKLEDDGRDIKDYMMHGGRAKNEAGAYIKISSNGNEIVVQNKEEAMYVDGAINELKKARENPQVNFGATKEAKLKDLESKLSSRRTAGELYNVTFEMAKHDVVVGTAGFFAARVMNFEKRLKERALYRGTSGVHDSPHHDKFSLGMPTYFEGVLEGDYKLKGRGLETVVNQGGFDLGSDKFWEDHIKENPAHYPADLIDKFEKSDVDRSMMWGMDTLFQNPSAEKWAQFAKKGGFNQYSDSEVKGINKEDSYGDTEASKREIMFADSLDRHLHWMNTKQARSKLEHIKYYSAAEKKTWIDQFATEELVTNKQRNHFYRKHLSIPVLGRLMSAEGAANLRVDINTTIGYLRRYKGTITWEITKDTVKDFLKAAFGYIFSD